MLRYITIALFVLSFFLTACVLTSSYGNKKPIDIAKVEDITISPSVGDKPKHLTAAQAQNFVDKWNNASSVGLVKCIVHYNVVVTLKDGNKRTIRICDNYAKEGNDYSFDLGESDYIENIWKEAK